MCCFSARILHVTDTLIFGRLSDDGYQYLAYQMKYESEEPNAMILPLPVEVPASETSIEFIDLSGYESFFVDLARAFPSLPQTKGILGATTESKSVASRLAVHEVGNFVASFVPSVDDFDRLDERFVIPKETWLKIPEYADYGFAVFQLKELVGKPHPMAFRFKTRTKSLFFPTVHIHDGEVHTEEDFDHILFAQHAGLDSVAGSYRGPWNSDWRTGLVRSADTAGKYCKIDKAKDLIAPDLLVHRKRLRGKLPNEDTLLMVDGSPTVPSFNYRKLIAWWPAALPFVGLAWLFNRRNRLKQEQNQNAAEIGQVE